MITKRAALLLSMALLSSAVGTDAAFAHVLIQNKTGDIGAVLHLTPDDNPIAGEESMLYFSMEQQSDGIDQADITITDEAGATTTIDASVGPTSVAARYVFPAQGLYTIALDITDQKTYNFEYSQRVSRGAGSTATSPDFPLAKAALIFSSVAMLGLGIYAINRRKEIFSQSTF